MSDREKSVLQRVRHFTPPLPQKSPSFLFVAQSRQKLRRVGSEARMTAVRYKRGDCSNKKQLDDHWISSLHYWGSKGGAVVRELASHQYCPSSNPGVDAICGLSFVVGFLPCSERFFSPGTPVLPSPQKPTFPSYSSTRSHVDDEPLCGCATWKSLFIIIYLFIIITPPVVAIRSAKLSPVSLLLGAEQDLIPCRWRFWTKGDRA